MRKVTNNAGRKINSFGSNATFDRPAQSSGYREKNCNVSGKMQSIKKNVQWVGAVMTNCCPSDAACNGPRLCHPISNSKATTGKDQHKK